MILNDLRNIRTGREILSEGYCDQPYTVLTEDNHWLCVLTTGKGEEGDGGQHIVSSRSSDKGKTWSALVDIEPDSGPEASWAMPLKTPSGRIYVFYVYNKDNVKQAIADKTAFPSGFTSRVDTLGGYFFKFSDDDGKSWSTERFEIPIRETMIDRQNSYSGKVRLFWGVGKPVIIGTSAYLGISKVGRFGEHFIQYSEGFLLKSSNILNEPDPNQVTWETLPLGDQGLKSPVGPIAEEQNLTFLNNNRLYCTYRTVAGYSCHAYSSDGGATWSPPSFMTYTPNGKKIKNPRAANFVRRLSCGKYIYWFHNHSGKGFEDRNPVWLCAGTEKDGHIYWGQPEIILYDDDPKVRMSYPDFIEQDGQLYITETEKETAYTHKIDKSLLAGMLSQFDCKEVKKSDLSFEKFDVPQGCNIKMPVLKGLNNGGSFAIEMLFKLTHLNSGQILFDNRRNNKKGILVSIDINNLLVISLSDGHNFFSWNCDPGVIYSDEWHHVVINVDGGPKIVTFVIDGILCDGGDYRQFGWGRFSPQLSDVNGESHSTLASHISGSVKLVRFYNSYLKTSEAVANYHATVESLLKNNQ